jgi:hypothetical protein
MRRASDEATRPLGRLDERGRGRAGLLFAQTAEGATKVPRGKSFGWFIDGFG